MEHKTHYATVSEALEQLRKQGFTIDFNLEENHIVFESTKLSADDFEIVDVYRYEGTSDPGDEATVYAIASKTGLKGVLVAGYGMSSDKFSTEILSKLNSRK
jgi:Fe2+ or Zn2+ uptake regulation protein